MNRIEPMQIMNTLNEVLEWKPQPKSRISQLLSTLRFYFWLYVLIRKKSHQKRVKQAMRVFQTLQRPEFKQAPGKLFSYIRTLDPFVFEELLLLAFKSRGLKVIHNKRYTGDGGIDGMVVLPSTHRIAILAKRYQQHIKVQHLHDFSRAIQAFGCHGGYFIHCGKSGPAAYQQLPKGISLISGNNLHRLLTNF
ncbi:restriction endonuclease [Legionella sp.]|uniref:restriction endonuclease n=1 Tax=Legionella sp. TaxID=459 RepID=UPI003D0B1C50